MKKLLSLSVFLSLLFLFCFHAEAQVPQIINYQGKLTNATGAPVNDTLPMVFTIYSDSGGTTPLWTETQPAVIVEKGVFNVLLGSVDTTNNPIPYSVFDGSIRYLGVKVGADPEITPRKPMVSVAYAFHSGTADTAYFSMPDADWVIDGDNIYHLNGNVGIGTTSPSNKLFIYDNSAGVAAIDLYTSNGIGGGSSGVPLTEINFGGADYALSKAAITCYGDYYTNLLGLQFKTTLYDDRKVTRMTITPSGNVGIGTTSPEERLDVNGSVKIATGGSFKFEAGGFDPYFKDDWGVRYHGDLTHPMQLESSALLVGYTAGGGGYSAGDVLVSGNVGIGTTSPAYKLDVIGDIRSTGTIHGNFDGTISNAVNSDMVDYKHDGQLTADIWDGHHWGDTYPYSSNSDLVDGIHGTSFLRNDQVNGVIQAAGSNSSEIIRAENNGSGQGIFARTHSTNGGSGISGDGAATGASDNSFGVAGSTHSPSGEQPPSGSSAGVYGLAANTGVGDAFGVLGRCWTHGGSGNPTAAGVFGWGDVDNGSTYGVWGETRSAQDGVSGVYGVNTATSGVTRGTIGTVSSTTAGAVGVLGSAPNTGAVRGVMGYCHSSNGYGVFSDGNFGIANGTKAAIVQTSRGTIKLYCQESPEIWFEDFGEGQLNNGKAHVELDALFLETVTINGQHPMKVFVQLNDECQGIYVKRGTTGFDVIELNNGKNNAQFTYRIVAKRKGYEANRLDQTDVSSREFTPPLSPTSTWKD